MPDVHQNYGNLETVSISTLSVDRYTSELHKVYTEEREKAISESLSVIKKVRNLHTSLLYYRNTKTEKGKVCYDIWKILVKNLSCTYHGWRNLGEYLKIPADDLNFITNAVDTEKQADILLQDFMQDNDATLDKILDGLYNIKRLDILTFLDHHIRDLIKYFNKDDSGYQSNTHNEGNISIVKLSKNLPNDLPPVLRKNYSPTKDPSKPPKLPDNKKNEIQSIAKPITDNNKILFLTFTEDGQDTANNIIDKINRCEDFSNVTVITLNNRCEEVFQNPELYIRECFEKADFMVPIVTNGYLEEIGSCQVTPPNPTDNLDYRYVNFIYNLIISHYVYANGCLNRKVRSILPEGVNIATIIRNISMYPDLMPWTFEPNFYEQFKSFLKIN